MPKAETAAKERPIIMSMESVQAILAGRKSQTRRVIKPQPPEGFHHNGRILWESLGPTPPPGAAGFRFGTMSEEEQARREGLAQDGKRYYGQGCRFGRQGDLLWVRETWSISGNGVFYRADTAQPETVKYAWKGPRAMRRKDSRLVLEVTGVRVHPLKDMTEEDARAEGFHDTFLRERQPGGAMVESCTSALDWYARTWNLLNAKRGFPWEEGLWVWAVEFKVAEA